MSYNTSIKQPIDQACAGQPSWHGTPPALVSSGKLRQGEEVISTLCLASMLFTRTIVCSSPFLPLSFLAKYRRALKKGPKHQSHSYMKKWKRKKKKAILSVELWQQVEESLKFNLAWDGFDGKQQQQNKMK